MEIKTKFSIGDKLWFMRNNNAYEMSINFIKINVNVDKVKIIYCFKHEIEGYIEFDETDKRIFTTKQELINSL